MINLPLNQILTGDSCSVLESFPDDCIDLTVTSPPYDNARQYTGHGFTFGTFQRIASQLYRVTKPGGAVVWNVNDMQDPDRGGESITSARQKIFFYDLGFTIHDTMIYMKSGPSHPEKNRYYQIFEYLFVMSKGELLTFNPIKDRINRWHKEKWSKVRTRRNYDGTLRESYNTNEAESKEGVRLNIWQYPVGAGNHGDAFGHEHPASMPEDLSADLITSFSNPGDVVLDPMCGSGTTLKMAKFLSRNYIGIDIAEEYAEIAKRRLAAIPQVMF